MHYLIAELSFMLMPVVCLVAGHLGTATTGNPCHPLSFL
ncbi:titan9 [Zea mays]|uniref:Titan9 n=1 Tax=Zea mays TaxID=4577 RepID=A0A1D6FBB3_MAIZE|nr:titan9 [Zea mays]